VVDEGHKKISSTEGHQHAQTSIFYRTRLENLPKKIDAIKHAFVEKDFKLIGEIAEAEALEFHQRVRDGFYALVAAEPERWLVVDATQSVIHVQQAIWQRVKQFINYELGIRNYATRSTNHLESFP